MHDTFKWMAIIVAGTLAAGCTKTDKTVTEEDEDEPIVEATPAPAEEVTIAEATPPPKRFAPEGVFYLITKKSIETDSGIVGFRPGTPAQLQPDGKYLVEGRTMELLPNEITNDLDLAARYAGADAQAQSALRQRLFSAAPPTPAPSGSNKKKKSTSPKPKPRPQGSTFKSTSSLNQTHTKVSDGWLWQKDGRGNWNKIKRVR